MQPFRPQPSPVRSPVRRRPLRSFLLPLLVLAFGALAAWAAADGPGFDEEMRQLKREHRLASVAAVQTHTSGVWTHAARGEVRLVEGASARLVRSDEGLELAFAARELTPGHAYTAWWIVIDEPGACTASPCSPEDVVVRHAATRSNVTYAAGAVADDFGDATFAARLAPGELEGGWYATPFERPATAHVHVLLNDHGPTIDGMEEEMVSTYRAGCRDDSLPPPFPDVAKADGTAGPNTCQLYQFAVFE